MQAIWLQDFRCFENLELFFSDGLNWIHGDNGSGKTSILEAIYWCGRARSFRTSRSNTLIAKQKKEALIRLTIEEQLFLGSKISSASANSFRFSGYPINKTSDLAQYFSTQFLGPQSHKLVEPEPDTRRQWLDWSLFHVKHSYLENYKRLKRGLSQRNQALRANRPRNLVTAFDPQIAELSILIERDKTDFVHKLNKEIDELKAAFKLNFDFDVDYKSSIPLSQTDYIKTLSDFFAQDQERGFTWHTAFRSKLTLNSQKVNASLVLSRGQQKLVAFILLLAQQKLLQSISQKSNVLLVDDLHAELDQTNRLLLADYLTTSKQQVLVTSTERPDKGMEISQMFHVKQ